MSVMFVTLGKSMRQKELPQDLAFQNEALRQKENAAPFRKSEASKEDFEAEEGLISERGGKGEFSKDEVECVT